MLVLCGFAGLELLQQGQAGAARKGRPVRGGADRRRRRRRARRRRRCAPRRSARSRSSAPSTARCARARRSSSTSRPPIPSRRCCRRIPTRRPRCASWSPSSTCTSSWSRASSTRRRSSAARSTKRDAARVRKRLERNIAALAASGPLRPLHRRRRRSRQADCAAWASFGVISMATQAVYGEDLLVAGGIDWKPYVKRLGERPSAQKVVADRKADAQDRAPRQGLTRGRRRGSGRLERRRRLPAVGGGRRGGGGDLARSLPCGSG